MAFLAFMAVSSASRQQKTAEKWRQKADDQAASDVVDNIGKARELLKKAETHEEKAKAAKVKADQKLSSIKDEDHRSIISGWTDDNRVRDNSGT